MRRSTLSGNPLARIPVREHRVTVSVVVLLDFVPSLWLKKLAKFPSKSVAFVAKTALKRPKVRFWPKNRLALP